MKTARAAWLLLAGLPSSAAFAIPLADTSLFLLFDRAASSASSASSASAMCLADFAPCTNAAFPDNFCCPAGTFCNALAGNTTVLCCPAGRSCAVLDPISCDVTKQDASQHPDSQLKTTALHAALPKCGDACCPFGYACSGGGRCVINANQNAAPLQTAVTSAAKATITATTKAASASTIADGTTPTGSLAGAPLSMQSSASPTPTGTANTDASGSDTSTDGHAGADNTVAVAPIVGGVLGGLAGLFGIGFVVWFVLARRRQARPSSPFSFTEKSRSSSSYGHHMQHPVAISAPQPQGDTAAFRTDFIRKAPSVSSQPYDDFGSVYGGVRSNHAPSITTPISTTPLGAGLGLGFGPDGNLPSPTPPPLRTNRRRADSQEINVGADPSLVWGGGGSYSVSPASTTAPGASQGLAPPSARDDRPVTSFTTFLASYDSR